MKKIFVTGGCGYKGTMLVPKLLELGYEVTVFDSMWFGNFLSPHERLSLVKGDIREIGNFNLKGYDIVIHMASVANDPCSDLNPLVNWEISCLATMQLAEKAARQGIKHFIYASSGSVYGIRSEDRVTEDLELLPISEYNKTKMVAERILLSYSDCMVVQLVRPATVCGYSKRMRLDVAVNLLTMQALTKGRMSILGGEQIRPNIHIQDMANVYLFLLTNPDITGAVNAGFENLRILDIAHKIAKIIPSEIEIKESNDPRSYRLDSSRLINYGFKPSKNVNDAILEVSESYKNGLISDDAMNYNLRWMIEKNIV
jgi:nucleoside-diphosphate-sugar epimerase